MTEYFFFMQGSVLFMSNASYLCDNHVLLVPESLFPSQGLQESCGSLSPDQGFPRTQPQQDMTLLQ